METVILVPSWQDQNNPKGSFYLLKILAFFLKQDENMVWLGHNRHCFLPFLQNEDPPLLLMFLSVKYYQICMEIEQNATFAASN